MPYDLYRRTRVSGYEGFYASILYAYFNAIGSEVRVEDIT